MVVVNRLCLGQTLVSNAFIDKYLSRAEGEYVKVYIMLLRQMESDSVSVSGLAAALSTTEKDVMRALFYWEEEGLVSVGLEDGRLVSLEVNSPVIEEEQPKTVPEKPVGEPSKNPELQKPAGGPSKAPELPSDMNDLAFKQLHYVTEQFFGRTLTRSDTSLLLWLKDDMKFPVEVIEYLIEYCVDRGHTKLSYIKAVANGWKEAGVASLEEAHSQVKKFDGDIPKTQPAASQKAHNFRERKTDLNALLAKELTDGTK